MREITGISIAAIQKLLDQLIKKKYVERGEKDGSWRVFVTQYTTELLRISAITTLLGVYNNMYK